MLFSAKKYSMTFNKHIREERRQKIIKYRITAVLKVKTDIITSMTASPVGQAVILMIMYVKMCFMSH